MAIVRNASILFICTMVGNFSNYSFQFLMGRTLSIEDFGAMNALLSVTMSITLPTTAIMFVIARYASTYAVMGETSGVSSLYTKALKRVAAAAVVVTGAFLLAGPHVAEYLKVGSLTPVTLLAIGIFGAFIMTVNLGMHQGLQRYGYLGAGLGLGGLLRLILGAVLVLAGLRLGGAILATVLPAMIIFAITFVPLSRYLSRGAAGFRHEDVLRYGVPVAIATSAFAFLSNVDLILVKHFLTPSEAGIYASVAVLGKTMLYLPSAFALAVFPMVTESTATGGDSFKILDRALLCTLLISAAGLAAFAAAPEFIMGLLFGARFAPAAPYLKYYGAAMSALSIMSILISFNMARAKNGFTYSLVFTCVLVVGLIYRFHDGILEVMTTILAAFLLLVAFNTVAVYRDRRVFYRVRNFPVCEPEGPNRDL